MNTAYLSDENLLKNVKITVLNERKMSAQVIELLEEVERRKLYSDLKYKNLFDYCVKELGYSEDQAWRRINAMKSTQTLQNARLNLNNGSLSITSINMATSMFNEASKESIQLSSKQKEEILNRCTNKTKSEVQETLSKIKEELNLSSEDKNKKNNNDNNVKIKTEINKNILEKLEKLKGLLAHKKEFNNHNLHQNANEILNQVLEYAVDAAIETEEKRKFAINSKITVSAKAQENKIEAQESKESIKLKETKKTDAENKSTPNQSNNQSSNNPARKRILTAAEKRELYLKQGGKCQICGSTYKLEIDHIVPIARAGANTLENCRLACSSCNKRAAIKVLGQKKMDQYLFKI